MPSAQVRVTESFAVAADIETVWRLLTDPGVIVSCMPGTEVVEEHNDGSIEGRMRVKLGPTLVDFGGTVTPEFDDVAHRGTLVARGADRTGRTRAQATTSFSVEAADEEAPGGGETSVVTVDGHIDVTGGLAGFVHTGGAHLARRMISDFAVAFRERSGRSNAAAGGIEPTAAEGASGVQARATGADAPAQAPAESVSGLRLIAAVAGDIVRTWWARIRRVPVPQHPRRIP